MPSNDTLQPNFLWKLKNLRLRPTDFCHAINLLARHGVTASLADSGRLLGRLVHNYLEKSEANLSDVDLSFIAGSFVAAKAKQNLRACLKQDLEIKISGQRARVALVLTDQSRQELSLLAEEAKLARPDADFLSQFATCTQQILKSNGVGLKVGPTQPEINFAPQMA